MIDSNTISAALKAKLVASGLVRDVAIHDVADFDSALESLRAATSSLAVIVSTGEEVTHQLVSGLNFPMSAEIAGMYSVFVSARATNRKPEDAAATGLAVKDQILALLMWDDLGVAGLLVLPQSVDPVRIEIEGAPASGRTAWKLDILCRQQLSPE